jgi:hypothetical protein
MRNIIFILSGLLAAQLVLAITMNLTDTEYVAFRSEEKLLAFDAESVDSLKISDGQSQLLLVKQDDGWVLPEQHNFPVSPTEIEQLLQQLSGMNKGWPVATSNSALKRFKVADDLFEHRLTLLNQDKELAQLYIGSSPGFRKVHARPGDEDRVFAIDFESWRVSVSVDDWIDKQLLKLEQDEITGIEISDINLANEGGQFKLPDLKPDEGVDQEKVDALVDAIAELQITSLHHEASGVEQQLDTSTIKAKVKTKGGDELVYQFNKPKDGDNYVLKRSDKPFSYTIAAASVDRIVSIDRNQLLQAENTDQKNEAETQELR